MKRLFLLSLSFVALSISLACAKKADNEKSAAPFEGAERLAKLDHVCVERNRPPHMYTAEKIKTNTIEEMNALQQKGEKAGCVNGGNESFPPDPKIYERLYCCP